MITVAVERDVEDVRECIEGAAPTHPSLIGPDHVRAERDNMVNVPTVTCTDEAGGLFRPHAPARPPAQRARRLDPDCAGQAGLEAGREQGILQPSLAEGPTTVLAQHIELVVDRRIETLELPTRCQGRQLCHPFAQFLLSDEVAILDAFPHLLGNRVRVLAGKSLFRQLTAQKPTPDRAMASATASDIMLHFIAFHIR